jgi:hypothetical protein
MYPHLTTILKELFSDNDMPDKPKKDWVWPKNAAALEEEAKRLTKTEKAIVAAGEHTEVRALVKAKKLQKLDKFLERVFDGDLTKNFCDEY